MKLSKTLALILVIALPFIGFWVGYNTKKGSAPASVTVLTASPTATPDLASKSGTSSSGQLQTTQTSAKVSDADPQTLIMARKLVTDWFDKYKDPTQPLEWRLVDYRIDNLFAKVSDRGLMSISVSYGIKPVSAQSQWALTSNPDANGWYGWSGCAITKKQGTTYQPIDGLATGCPKLEYLESN